MDALAMEGVGLQMDMVARLAQEPDAAVRQRLYCCPQSLDPDAGLDFAFTGLADSPDHLGLASRQTAAAFFRSCLVRGPQDLREPVPLSNAVGKLVTFR